MANGAPVAVPIAPDPVLVIHTLDATPATSGGPAIDQVTLIVQNNDPAAIATVHIVHAGVTLTFLVPAAAMLRVYDETMFGGTLSGAGGQTISVQIDLNSVSTDATVWGWFVRTQG